MSFSSVSSPGMASLPGTPANSAGMILYAPCLTRETLPFQRTCEPPLASLFPLSQVGEPRMNQPCNRRMSLPISERSDHFFCFLDVKVLISFVPVSIHLLPTRVLGLLNQ